MPIDLTRQFKPISIAVLTISDSRSSARWRRGGSRASGSGVSGAVNASRLALGLTKAETNRRWFEPAERPFIAGQWYRDQKTAYWRTYPPRNGSKFRACVSPSNYHLASCCTNHPAHSITFTSQKRRLSPTLTR